MPQSQRLRKSGFQLFGEIPWGSHLCLFYQTYQDLLDLLAPYFRAGFDGKESCVWATSEPVAVDQAKAALAGGFPDFASHLASGEIEIDCDRYPQQSGVDSRRIIAGWLEKLQTALDRGYEGLRISGNALWSATDWRDFREYERDLDRALSGKRIIAAYTYRLDDSEATDLLDVARAHGNTIALRRGVWERVEAAPIELSDHPLTEREAEVLRWVANGKSAWEIGAILGITKRTVDRHVEKAVEKLGAGNRSHAVAIAIRDRIVR